MPVGGEYAKISVGSIARSVPMSVSPSALASLLEQDAGRQMPQVRGPIGMPGAMTSVKLLRTQNCAAAVLRHSSKEPGSAIAPRMMPAGGLPHASSTAATRQRTGSWRTRAHAAT